MRHCRAVSGVQWSRAGVPIGPLSHGNEQCEDGRGCISGRAVDDRRRECAGPPRGCGHGLVEVEHQMRLPVRIFLGEVLLVRKHVRHGARSGCEELVRRVCVLRSLLDLARRHPSHDPLGALDQLGKNGARRRGIEAMRRANPRIPECRIAEVAIECARNDAGKSIRALRGLNEAGARKNEHGCGVGDARGRGRARERDLCRAVGHQKGRDVRGFLGGQHLSDEEPARGNDCGGSAKIGLHCDHVPSGVGLACSSSRYRSSRSSRSSQSCRNFSM